MYVCKTNFIITNLCLLQVGTKLFPAHIFIIASNSEFLYKLYQDKLKVPGDKPTVTLENVHPEVFDRILRFMYTGTCDVAQLGACSLKIRREDLPAMKKEKENDDVDLELIGEYLAPKISKN
jgi:hypothetical protein